MKELFKLSPARTIFTLAYLAFAFAYLVYGFLPARAEDGPVSGRLAIPSADLYSDVTPSRLEGHELYVPSKIVSAYHSGEHKILLMAHSTSAFTNLPRAGLHDLIFYSGRIYRVVSKNTLPVAEIDMKSILADTPRDTLILMTCAGEEVDGAFTHRLIIQAETI